MVGWLANRSPKGEPFLICAQLCGSNMCCSMHFWILLDFWGLETCWTSYAFCFPMASSAPGVFSRWRARMAIFDFCAWKKLPFLLLRLFFSGGLQRILGVFWSFLVWFRCNYWLHLNFDHSAWQVSQQPQGAKSSGTLGPARGCFSAPNSAKRSLIWAVSKKVSALWWKKSWGWRGVRTEVHQAEKH